MPTCLGEVAGVPWLIEGEAKAHQERL